MAKKTETALGRNIELWMKERGLTFADVANMTEDVAHPLVGRVDVSGVHRIVRNAVPNPRVLTVQALCDVFGKSIDEAMNHQVRDPLVPRVRRNRRRS